MQIAGYDGVLDGYGRGCRSTQGRPDLQAVERRRVALRQLNAAVDCRDCGGREGCSRLGIALDPDVRRLGLMLPSTVTLNALSCAPERT